jgi:hypothetical protein
MTRSLLALAVALAIAPAASAQDGQASDMAESRLRGCLLAGSSAAPHTNLREAVIAVRSFCSAQIHVVRDGRVAAATAGLSGSAATEAEDSAVRALNEEIARAVANFTGLTL